MIAHIGRIRREVLGLNRRNHDFLFRWNPRTGYHVADDKRTTKTVLAAAGVATPVLHAHLDRAWQLRWLRARLETLGRFALKPARGAGGAGIVVAVGADAEGVTKPSGVRLAWPAVEAHAADVVAGAYSPMGLEDTLLVEALVVSHPDLARLAHRGVPDVRILVFRGVPLLAMLRLPTRSSDGRANLHLGGLGVGVDLGQGTTANGVHGGRPATRHPDVGLDLAGHAIPLWADVLRIAARAARATGLGFLGVDVGVDADRGPLVLELNARPGLAIQLANRRGLRPLLDRVATAAIPEDLDERIAFGRALAST